VYLSDADAGRAAIIWQMSARSPTLFSTSGRPACKNEMRLINGAAVQREKGTFWLPLDFLRSKASPSSRGKKKFSKKRGGPPGVEG